MNRRILMAVGVVSAAAVIAAACTGGGGSAGTETQPAASPAPATGQEEGPKEGPTPTPEPTPRVERQQPPPGTSSWGTNWDNRTINLNELISGGPPRDGIPPLDDPVFKDVASGDEYLEDRIPVVVLEINGDVRAYPLDILTLHEVVNDEVGGVPVVVTFCPLCNTAIAFDRRVDGQLLTFGTSGLLRFSDLVMWDRQTESLWQQITGEGIVGDMAGKQLTFLPISLINWGQFKESYPGGQVLSRDSFPLYTDLYGFNPYTGYDSSRSPFLFTEDVDERLPAFERVVGIRMGGEAVAYPFSGLAEELVVHDQVGDQEFVIFWGLSDTASALDASNISQGQAVGAATVFDPVVDGQRLTFVGESDVRFRDNETGSVWNVAGQATDGPLAGKKLRPVVYGTDF
ncbi:MAG: DUF3179 domain-containing protein [Dehalococcoidia bacterium]